MIAALAGVVTGLVVRLREDRGSSDELVKMVMLARTMDLADVDKIRKNTADSQQSADAYVQQLETNIQLLMRLLEEREVSGD